MDASGPFSLTQEIRPKWLTVFSIFFNHAPDGSCGFAGTDSHDRVAQNNIAEKKPAKMAKKDAADEATDEADDCSKA